MRLKRIKIEELSADTVAQSEEHLRDKQKAWVQILASVRFLFVLLCSSMLSWQSIGRSNFDRGLHSLIILIKNYDNIAIYTYITMLTVTLAADMNFRLVFLR